MLLDLSPPPSEFLCAGIGRMTRLTNHPQDRTPPNHPGSLPLLDVSPETPLESQLEGLDHLISDYLSNDTQLPLWQPRISSEHIRSHITDLKIPAISKASAFPSLLLHNLGETSHDPDLIGRVENLFSGGSR
jgi:hypothetical protein